MKPFEKAVACLMIFGGVVIVSAGVWMVGVAKHRETGIVTIAGTNLYTLTKRLGEAHRREVEALKKLEEAAFKEGVQSGVNFTLNWALSHGGNIGQLPVSTISEQCWTNRLKR